MITCPVCGRDSLGTETIRSTPEGIRRFLRCTRKGCGTPLTSATLVSVTVPLYRFTQPKNDHAVWVYTPDQSDAMKQKLQDRRDQKRRNRR